VPKKATILRKAIFQKWRNKVFPREAKPDQPYNKC
jgi:hypothetical protein